MTNICKITFLNGATLYIKPDDTLIAYKSTGNVSDEKLPFPKDIWYEKVSEIDNSLTLLGILSDCELFTLGELVSKGLYYKTSSIFTLQILEAD